MILDDSNLPVIDLKIKNKSPESKKVPIYMAYASPDKF